MVSSVGFPPPFIRKPIAKPKSRSILWKPNSEFLSILSKIIGPGSYEWLSLFIIIPKTRVLAIRLLSLIVTIIFAFPFKENTNPRSQLKTSDELSIEL